MTTNTTVYSASDARQNLYNLIKTAATGLTTIEINLRHTEPVIMMSKADYDSWLETLDVMSSPDEVKAIKASQKKRKLISHEKMRKILGI